MDVIAGAPLTKRSQAAYLNRYRRKSRFLRTKKKVNYLNRNLLYSNLIPANTREVKF